MEVKKRRKYKQQWLHLTGGNIGRMQEGFFDFFDDSLVDLFRVSISFEEVAKNGREHGWETALKMELERQDDEVSDFLSIDRLGGFREGNKDMAKKLAQAVAKAPFERCIDTKVFKMDFSKQEVAAAIRDRHDCIYVEQQTTPRYCAASKSAHDLLKKRF